MRSYVKTNVAALAMALSFAPAWAAPVGTAITYQGQIKLGGVPVSETCDFEFTLWDDLVATLLHNQVGPTLIFDGQLGNSRPVRVVNGLFTAALDFGSTAFNGDSRWLQIDVCCSSPCSPRFTKLTPRQPLTATPYSLQTRGLFVDTDGHVGIGTDTPSAKLDVRGATSTETLEITGGSPLDQPLAGWGDNTFGQVNIPAGTFMAVAAGAVYSLAIRSDGTLVGWGSGSFGQINVPAGVFTAVAAGLAHSLAIRSNGTLVGWGLNNDGQINVPAGRFTAVAAGGSARLGIEAHHSLAIRSDGTLAGWGSNGLGQIDVPAGTFTAIAASGPHSLAIRSDGILFGWGLNNAGQINVPAGTFTVVAAGGTHSLAIGVDPTPGDFALVLAEDSAFKPGTNTWTILSDRRLKNNVQPLIGALERLLQLRGVMFEWRDAASQGARRGTEIGLIADEVESVFPQWVGRDPRGYQTLTIGGFEALTAEAFRDLRKEKDAQIKELGNGITIVKARLAKLEALLAQSPIPQTGGAP